MTGLNPKSARPVRNPANRQHLKKGKISNRARAVAAAALNQFDPKRNYAGPILDKLLPQTGERQRATDLVFGTIRNQTAIDTVIAKFANCPVERISAKILNIIRIGAYELIYSPAAPDYSIINEAVENTKITAGKKQTGFVNALLRQIARHIKNRQISLSDADPQRTLPQTPSTGCEFDTNILQNPEDSPAGYFSCVFSLPKWLISDWLAQFSTEQVRQICFGSNRKPSIYIRPNTLKTTIQRLAEKFHQANIDLEIAADTSMIKIKAARAVTELPGFAEGLFSVQDITAAQPVRLLQPQPEWTILDLCAAPGTKTTQLAELTNDSAKIIATDIDSGRLEKVKENTDRLGINSVRIIPYEELFQNSKFEIRNSRFPASGGAGPFDCILLDVPCSNTGVLAKRPEARYRIRPKMLQELTKIQGKLLETAAAIIKPKGKICYSTCSIESRENSGPVRKFLRKNSRLKLESENLILPSAEGFDCDGGYVAILSKR